MDIKEKLNPLLIDDSKIIGSEQRYQSKFRRSGAVATINGNPGQ